MDALQPVDEKRAQGLPERLFRLATLASGLVLFGLMCLVAVSVVFRYVLNSPILGSQEIVQIGMVFVVMLAMPYTAITEQHIRVDILDKYLGTLGGKICDFIGRLAGLFVLWLLVQKAWSKMLDAREYEDVTNMIELPLWWAYGAICVGMALYGLVLVIQIIRTFTGDRTS